MTQQTARPTYVYFLHGARGELLYIGCSQNLRQRRSEHAVFQRWWARVHSWRLVGPFSTRTAALAYEREQIREHQPPHNLLHTQRARRPA